MVPPPPLFSVAAVAFPPPHPGSGNVLQQNEMEAEKGFLFSPLLLLPSLIIEYVNEG